MKHIGTVCVNCGAYHDVIGLNMSADCHDGEECIVSMIDSCENCKEIEIHEINI